MQKIRDREKGFTLIELMVVIAIIGILATISASYFLEYRRKSFDARALNDLRNGANAQSAVFADTESYVVCADTAACVAALPGIVAFSKTVEISFSSTDPQTEFTGTSSSSSGSGVTYTWDSSAGGLQ